jgi:hypothetical protein
MAKFVQHANMQFCFKPGKTATEINETLVTTYRSDAVTKNAVFMLCA